MKLRKYENKCVKIVTTYEETFEGICTYNDEEYSEHEFGRKEECLQIENFLFYKNYIKEIHDLENNKGPYGKFTQPYGKLEELTVEDGIDSIKDILFSEEEEHAYRLLSYIENHINLISEYQSEMLEILKDLMKYTKNRKIKEKVNLIISKLK